MPHQPTPTASFSRRIPLHLLHVERNGRHKAGLLQRQLVRALKNSSRKRGDEAERALPAALRDDPIGDIRDDPLRVEGPLHAPAIRQSEHDAHAAALGLARQASHGVLPRALLLCAVAVCLGLKRVALCVGGGVGGLALAVCAQRGLQGVVLVADDRVPPFPRGAAGARGVVERVKVAHGLLQAVGQGVDGGVAGGQVAKPLGVEHVDDGDARADVGQHDDGRRRVQAEGVEQALRRLLRAEVERQGVEGGVEHGARGAGRAQGAQQGAARGRVARKVEQDDGQHAQGAARARDGGGERGVRVGVGRVGVGVGVRGARRQGAGRVARGEGRAEQGAGEQGVEARDGRRLARRLGRGLGRGVGRGRARRGAEVVGDEREVGGRLVRVRRGQQQQRARGGAAEVGEERGVGVGGARVRAREEEVLARRRGGRERGQVVVQRGQRQRGRQRHAQRLRAPGYQQRRGHGGRGRRRGGGGGGKEGGGAREGCLGGGGSGRGCG